MNPEEKNLSKLRNLLAVMDSASMTQEEFIESFQVVIDLAKQIQDTNAEEFESIRNEVQALSDKLAEDAKNNVFEAMDGFENKFKTAFKTIAEREVANCEKMMKAKMLEIDAEASAKIESLEVEPTPTLEEVVNALEPRIKIPTPVPGEPGKPGKDGSPDTGEEIIKKINKAETLIDPTAIKGFEQLQKDVKEKTGNTTRIGWGAHPLVVQGLGVVKDKNTRNINFKGAGVSSVVRNANGVVDVTISGSSGGAFTDLTDTFASYTGKSLQVLRVNAGQTGIETVALAGGGDALKSDPLSQFAATTSLQLKGVMSDETGSGALVFATSPTLVTPVLGAATATTINGATITSGTLNGSVTGTNTGDQTSIVGITGTKAQFDTAVTDGNILYVGDSITSASVSDFTEASQDAVGAMVDASLTYVDATPLLQRAALTGDVTASAGSNATTVVKINGTTLSGLATGILKNTTGTGVPSIATAGTDYSVPTGTETITNKRPQPRTASSTSNATLTPDLSSANVYYRTTQTVGLTIAAPTGTPVIGEVITIYVDSAGAQTLTMNATYIVFGAAFPASTTAGKTLMITAQFNGTDWETTWVNQV